VWIRIRPFEIVWRTTHSFAVDDIRLVEIEPLVGEHWRRRVVIGRARTRLSLSARTRLTLQYGNEEVRVDLNETPASIAEVFEDLADRLAADGSWHPGTNPSSCLPQVGEEPGPTTSSLAPEPEIDADLQRELFRMADRKDRAASGDVGDALFSEGPPGIAWRRHDLDDDSDAARSPSVSAGESLFPDEEPSSEARHGIWIRRRKSRTRRLLGRRSAS